MRTRVIKIQTIGPRAGPLTGRAPTDRCPRSGKLMFDTEDAALYQSWSWSSQNRFRNGRAYRCQHCSTWHLTSRP